MLSIFWDETTREADLWYYKFVIANLLSAFLSCRIAGSTAPKFNFGTTCVCASGYLLVSAIIIYGMVAMSVGLDSETVVTTFFATLGAILAIWRAKINPSYKLW